MQPFLPLTLLFLVRYIKFSDPLLLAAAAATTGIAIIIHPALAAITIVLPSLFYLTVSVTGDPQDKDQIHQLSLWLREKKWWQKTTTKLGELSVFIFLSALVGAPGVYTAVFQTFFSGGAGRCDNP